MFCNYCGANNPDSSNFCSHCGKNISARNSEATVSDAPTMYTVEIFRESQMFLINPPINISIDGKKNLSVANGETLNLQLEEGHHDLVFSLSFRKRIVSVDLTQNIYIKLKWNRTTGALEAKVSEQ